MSHHGRVEVEKKRDQKTIAIGAALGIFALIVVAGAAMLWLADSLGLSGDLVSGLQLPLFGVAGVAMIVYLARARGR